jgi:ribonuclease R
MDNLNALYDLYKALKGARSKRGVMDFDRIETQVLFDDNGKMCNGVIKNHEHIHLSKRLKSGRRGK